MENELDKLEPHIEHSTQSINTNCKTYTSLSSLPNFILQWIEKNLNDVILVWDQHGQGIFFSKSIKRVLGFEGSELHGTSWKELVLPEDIPLIERYLEDGLFPEKSLNLNFKTKDDQYKWCECRTEKIEQNGEIFFLTTLNDNTDKKKIEEMVIQSEKMSVAGQLAAGVAHEIRNPLTSIKGFLQLLQAGVNRKEVYYKIMIDEIEKMEKITSELLFISKPLTDEKKEESVNEMVEDVVKLLKSQAKLKNIILEHIHESEHFITCDRSQIKQVLLNIVKNAIEAMEDPGTIQIVVSPNGNGVQIDIIDEGPGIPKEVIHKLGEPFFTTKQDGTGLGLMITKQILERHHASLDIFQNNNKGSTFRISFPALQK